jgi:hypothetical protein
MTPELANLINVIAIRRKAQLAKALRDRGVPQMSGKVIRRLTVKQQPIKRVGSTVYIEELWSYRGRPILEFKLDIENVGGADASRLRDDPKPDHARRDQGEGIQEKAQGEQGEGDGNRGQDLERQAS